MEILTNLYFYVKYISKIKKVREAIKPIDLLKYPEKDNTLVPVKQKSFDGYLLNKVPNDEYSKKSEKVVKLIKFLNVIFKCSKNNKYYVNSDNECIELYQKLYKEYFEITVMPEDKILPNSPFYGAITRDNEYYVIDSTHMNKYEYKKNYLAPAIKAYFRLSGNNLELETIEHGHKEYTNFDNIAGRLLFNYLLIDTVINKHLIITHIKVAEIFSYAVRKYLSSGNPVKHFLWNFCLGTHVTNHNLIPLLLNKVLDFFPFTEKGLQDYINDSIKSDQSRWMFPDKLIKSDLISDSEKIFSIYKSRVDELLAGISNEYINEVRSMAPPIRNIVHEYENIDIVNMLASFMFVSSILHYTSNKMLFNYVVKGHTYPVAINKQEKVHKYDYLQGLETLLESMLPMRKLVYVMQNMHPYAKEQYQGMIHDLIDQKFEIIDILSLDSAVQI